MCAFILFNSPCDELDEGGRELDPGLGVEDGGVRVADEVGGHHLILGVAQVSLHRALGGLPAGRAFRHPNSQTNFNFLDSLDALADVLVGGVLLQPDREVDDGDVGGGHAEGHPGQLARQLGDDLADGLGGARRGGDDVLEGRRKS